MERVSPAPPRIDAGGLDLARGSHACERSAQRLSPLPEGAANDVAKAFRVGDGDARLGQEGDRDDRRVDFGTRYECARRNAEGDPSIAVESRPDAEGAVRLGAGSGDDPLGDLALQHQDETREVAARFEQADEDLGPHAVREVADRDGAVVAVQEAREIDFQGIPMDHAHVSGPGVVLPQAIRQPRIDLHEDELGRRRGQRIRERAEPGTDFHDSPPPYVRDVDDPSRHAGCHQKALTEASRRPHAEMRQRLTSRTLGRWDDGHGRATTGGSRSR